MAQLVTIQQAARDALKTWLVTELAAVTGLVVEPRWFETDRQHPQKSISIIDAGPRKIEWLQEPEIIAQASVDATHVEITWGLGYVEQLVQLDVWAPSDVELDDLMARLDGALNAGQRAAGVTNVEPVGIGLLLNLAGAWAPGTVDLTFDEPHVFQTADEANQAQWRASYRGVANAMLVVKANSPRLARVALKQRISESDAASVNQDVMTLTPTTETYSTEP